MEEGIIKMSYEEINKITTREGGYCKKCGEFAFYKEYCKDCRIDKNES